MLKITFTCAVDWPKFYAAFLAHCGPGSDEETPCTKHCRSMVQRRICRKKCINEGLQNRFTVLLLKESCLLLLLVKGHIEAHVVVTYKWDRDFFFALTISTIFENFYWFREL